MYEYAGILWILGFIVQDPVLHRLLNNKAPKPILIPFQSDQ